jgi:hypothetical protein
MAMRDQDLRITNEHDKYEDRPHRHLSLERGGLGGDDDDADPAPLADRDDSPASDTALREEVAEALRLHTGLDARDIDIYVAQGEVTILGVVGSFREEQLAIDIAQRCPGVSSVLSQLRLAIVPLPQDGEGSSRE